MTSKPDVHPIQMSAPMVQAILAGEKTVTRRIIHPQPWQAKIAGQHPGAEPRFKAVACGEIPGSNGLWCYRDLPTGVQTASFRCPYGTPGDVLWCREQWCTDRLWDQTPPASIWPREACDARIHFLADGPVPPWAGRARSGRHLPRRFARLWLQVVGIMPSHLQTITVPDIAREGVRCRGAVLPRDAFRELWDMLQGSRLLCDYESDPMVWRVEFAVVPAGQAPVSGP